MWNWVDPIKKATGRKVTFGYFTDENDSLKWHLKDKRFTMALISSAVEKKKLFKKGEFYQILLTAWRQSDHPNLHNPYVAIAIFAN